jgi:transcriptional regulator GlxA family with amidase domain
MSDRLKRIENWEELAVKARFRPEDMAELCPISLRQLQRFFVAHFNQTPGRWIRGLKCRLARDLIARGLPNKAVLEELSFGNESHLCHEFKRFFGASPQTFSPLQRKPSRSTLTKPHSPVRPPPIRNFRRLTPAASGQPFRVQNL